ncbi:hypothetical protein Taro_041214, partial [Colocasia esculenta]|nr:hypothetical protein [Colocasia esculenta]
GSFPTEPVTCEAHPYSFQVRVSRRLLILRLVLSRTVAGQVVVCMHATCRTLGDLLTSALGRRQPPTSRLGRDGGLRRIPNCDAFLRKVGQTELPQALLGQERLLQWFFGRLGVLVSFSAWSRREDVLRSGGNAGLWLFFMFFAKGNEKNMKNGFKHQFTGFMGEIRELGPESLKVTGMGLRQCGPQGWCWLVSTVCWLVLVERQLDLTSVVARLRGEGEQEASHPSSSSEPHRSGVGYAPLVV